jgi:hypothetical protein
MSLISQFTQPDAQPDFFHIWLYVTVMGKV